MTEREFVEKIAVRREQGLCKISDASAWRYAKELRKGSELNAQLQADGILEVGKCLLDLTEADVIHDTQDPHEIAEKIAYLLKNPNHERLATSVDFEHYSKANAAVRLHRICDALLAEESYENIR